MEQKFQICWKAGKIGTIIEIQAELLVEVERSSSLALIGSSVHEIVRRGHAGLAETAIAPLHRLSIQFLLHGSAIFQRDDGDTTLRVAVGCGGNEEITAVNAELVRRLEIFEHKFFLVACTRL